MKPICVNCGNSYGHRLTKTEHVRWTEDQERPAYRGNLAVLRFREHGKQLSKSILQEAANQKPGPWQAKMIDDAPEKTTYSGYYELWDGESYAGGYKPFCTLRCALDYARKAYAKTKLKVSQ
jgi:hypothetical protein